MTSWRNLFLEGTLEPVSLIISLGYSVLAFFIGSLVYKKLSWKFAEVL
jgi:lipopolysaccharide transport system permease protein